MNLAASPSLQAVPCHPLLSRAHSNYCAAGVKREFVATRYLARSVCLSVWLDIHGQQVTLIRQYRLYCNQRFATDRQRRSVMRMLNDYRRHNLRLASVCNDYTLTQTRCATAIRFACHKMIRHINM